MKGRLEQLFAEADIRALHVRYCRAADRLDQALMRACFHADARFDFPVFSGGLEGFIDMAWQTLARFSSTRHMIGNQLVEVDGHLAWAEHYTVATHRIEPDAQGPLRDYIAHVRYLDELECRGGAWKIARRVLLTDLSRTDPVPLPAPRASDGRRDPSDRSYAIAANFAARISEETPH